MNTSSTFLYDLVHSLSKSEKRYIKIKAGTGPKDYLYLMDALLSQKSFDEEQLIKKNKEKNFIKHLAVNKRYLYEFILQSLSDYQQESLEDKVLQRINATQVLMGKGLYEAAVRELKKAQKIVDTYEFFDLQIMINNLQKKLMDEKQFKSKNKASIVEIFQKGTHALQQLQNINQYWYLSQQLIQFQMQYQKIQTDEQKNYLDELIASPKLKDESLATNLKSQLHFYKANALYQFMQGDIQKAYTINRQFLEALDTKPHFLRLYREQYLSTLNNILIDSLIMGKFELLEEGIEKLIKTPDRKEFKSIKNIDSRVFRQKYLLLLNWSLRQQDFKKALEWIPDIEEGLHEFGNKIEKHHQITFYFLMAYVLFQNQRFDDALIWNNIIIYESKEDVVKEIFYFARSLNLMIHFELENFNLLESLLLSTPKFLKSRRTLYQTEKSLFRFFGKYINALNKREKQKHIQEFNIEIDTLMKNPKESRVFNYLDLKFWIEYRKR